MGGGKEGDKTLLYLALEDGLKKRYSNFVAALEAGSRDNLEFIMDKAIKTMFELLRWVGVGCWWCGCGWVRHVRTGGQIRASVSGDPAQPRNKA